MAKPRKKQVAVDVHGRVRAVGDRRAFRPGENTDQLLELPPTYARRPGTFEVAAEGEEHQEACGCISRVLGGRWRLVHVCGKR